MTTPDPLLLENFFFWSLVCLSSDIYSLLKAPKTQFFVCCFWYFWTAFIGLKILIILYILFTLFLTGTNAPILCVKDEFKSFSLRCSMCEHPVRDVVVSCINYERHSSLAGLRRKENRPMKNHTQKQRRKRSSTKLTQLKPDVEFYRRILPSSCISFSSEKGKVIFAEALASGHMNCYFKLASQFRTQDEPAFCGLSTLVMVLTALDVDPGVVWKRPWRWYHENMLDCCIPLDIVKRNGITLEQFTCIAECNSLQATVVRPRIVEMSVDHFREVIKSYTQCDDAFLVATYSRKVLNQTGDGHFSPIAGYHPDQDLVLIMDTARFKYPPHWVKLPHLLEAMNALDKDTALPRGYIMLSRKANSSPLLLFRISSTLTLMLHSQLPADILQFLKNWQDVLKEKIDTEQREAAIINTVHKLLSLTAEINDQHKLLEFHAIKQDCPCDLVEEYREYGCAVHKLLQELEATKLFLLVRDIMKLEKQVEEQTKSFCHTCRKLPNVKEFTSHIVADVHLVTMLLLSWPFCPKAERNTSDDPSYLPMNRVLHDFIEEELSPGLLQTEVTGLSRQLSVILRLYTKQQSVTEK